MIYITALSLLSKEERGYFIRRRLNAFREGTQGLAQIFKVNKSTMFRWITGKSVPAGENLKKFEELFYNQHIEKPFEFYSKAEIEAYEKNHDKIEYVFYPIDVIKDSDYNFIYDIYSYSSCNNDKDV